jgi:hypothetical protein
VAIRDVPNAQFWPMESRQAVVMTDVTRRPIGRPSKGPRHSFTIKLDLVRAAKLKQILASRHTTGIEYLTPIIEAHIDAVEDRRLSAARSSKV